MQMNRQDYTHEVAEIIRTLTHTLNTDLPLFSVFKNDKERILCYLDNVIYRTEALKKRLENEFNEDKCQ